MSMKESPQLVTYKCLKIIHEDITFGDIIFVIILLTKEWMKS